MTMAETIKKTKKSAKKAAKKTTKKTTKKTAKKAAKKVSTARDHAEDAIDDLQDAAAHAGDSVESIFKRIQANLKEAHSALNASGEIANDKRRDVMNILIDNAQENTDATFEALRDVMEAESIGESLRIQRDALREGIERNVAQVRDVASVTADSSRDSFEPVSEYLSTLRRKTRNGANA